MSEHCGAECPIYFCPISGEHECPHHGGFTVCCSEPQLHVPLQVEFSPEELSRIINEQARRVGMTGEELITAYHEGTLEDEGEVFDILMLIDLLDNANQ